MASSKKLAVKSAPRRGALRPSGPIEVQLVVVKFNDVLQGGAPGEMGCDYVMKLRREDPRVRIDGTDLLVKRPGGLIRFTVVADGTRRERYYPVGITFMREGARSSSDAQRLGLLNFPQGRTQPDGSSIIIADTYRDPAKRVRFKFSVVIQRGSDGSVGIIDPGIVHDGDQ
ncbi:MAG TPA: hypothetical protein VHD32_06995 [Candidatus Didemnitutus sp.]|nr:hypothetical protein [Candidatus Didemnitutus sp.]